MERCRFFALQRYLFRTYRVHEMAVINAAGKEPQSQAGTTQNGVTRHQHDIHLTVLYTGFRCNQCLVTPLVCIGKRDQEGLMRHVNAVTYDVVVLRLIAECLLDDILQVRHETAFVAGSEVIGYHCIKTRATCADKQLTVRQTIVHTDRFTVVDHLQCFLRTDRNVQVTRKTISATHRNNSECSLTADT